MARSILILLIVAAWGGGLWLVVTVGKENRRKAYLIYQQYRIRGTLKTLGTAEADFRANDRDGNGIQDFWVGDVAGLHYLTGPQGIPLYLIEMSAANLDGAPLADGVAAGRYRRPALEPFAGYRVRVMTHYVDDDGGLKAYAQSTGGKPDLGPFYNHCKFAFCLYPSEYVSPKQLTYILNEESTMFKKDTKGQSVLTWPTDPELKASWTKAD